MLFTGECVEDVPTTFNLSSGEAITVSCIGYDAFVYNLDTACKSYGVQDYAATVSSFEEATEIFQELDEASILPHFDS